MRKHFRSQAKPTNLIELKICLETKREYIFVCHIVIMDLIRCCIFAGKTVKCFHKNLDTSLDSASHLC